MTTKNTYAPFDLHLHSFWSYDATAAIEPYFKLALERHVSCIAITDHHNMDGQAEVQQIAARYPGIRLIPAAELTVTHSLGGSDLLCYGLPTLPPLEGVAPSKPSFLEGVAPSTPRRQQSAALHPPSDQYSPEGATVPGRQGRAQFSEQAAAATEGRDDCHVVQGQDDTCPSLEPLVKILHLYHTWQQEYGAAVSKGLQTLGYDYPDERRLSIIRAYRPQRTIDRQGVTHVRNRVQREAFHAFGFMPDSSPASYSALMTRVAQTVPMPSYPSAEQVVPAVKEAGGIVVIAHPQRYFHGKDLQRMDQLRNECGLDGLECAHPTVSPELTPFYRQYCLQHGLVSTGGSDSHDSEHLAPSEPGYTSLQRFACHLGEEDWLDEFLSLLDSRA